MNKLFYLIILFFACNISYAQNVFQKSFSVADTGLVWQYSNILPLQDSSFIFLTSLQENNSSDTSKSFVVKVNSAGNIIWQKAINTDSTIYLRYINYANDGYLITGTIWHQNYHSTVVVIKIDYNGDTLWSRMYPFAGLGSYVKQMPNGDCLIIGSNGYTPTQSQRHMVMRTDSLGSIIYYNKYHGNWFGVLTGFATSDGGTLLFDPGLTFRKLDSAGNILWTTPQYNAIYAAYNGAVETIDSSYMVVANCSGDSSLTFIKISALGDTIWTRSVGNPLLHTGAWSIKALTNGCFVVCGYTYNPMTNDARPLLIKIDSLANVLWSKTFHVNNNSSEYGYSLSTTYDNGFIIEGISYDTLQLKWSVFLIKTDSMGNSSCPADDDSLINVSVPVITDTIFSIPITPLTASMSNLSIHCQNSYLMSTDTCSQSTSTNEISGGGDDSISIFPNPVTNKLNVYSGKTETLEIILYDIASRKLLNQQFTNSVSLNTQQLAKGIYLYQIRNHNEIIKTGKVVKE